MKFAPFALQLVIAINMAWIFPPGHAKKNTANDINDINAQQIKRGQYLTLAADCNACHTIDTTKPFAGGYPLETPFGTIYGPNITPDKATGIGSWTDEDFIRALHLGIGKNGEHLYPAFPYTAFTQLSRDDVLAIKSYLFSLPPIHQKTPENELSFPFNHRVTVAGWKLFNFKPERWQPDTSKSAEYNRGMYLTESLAHCQECHTPRNITMGLDNKRAFGGATLAGWTAYNITSDKTSGVGAWEDSELVRYFKTGLVSGKAIATGEMAEAVEHSLQFLTEPDLQAIVTYLRTVPAIRDGADHQPRFAWGKPSPEDLTLRGIASVSTSNLASGGAELFSGNCASCHSASGSGGKDGYYPPLFHNTTIGARNPGNLIMVILHGVQRDSNSNERPDVKNTEVFMPGFADKLNDGQIALLSNFIVQQFGNPTTPAITEEQISQRRKKEAGNTDGIWSSIIALLQELWRQI